MSFAFADSIVAQAELTAFKFRGWRVRRSDIDQL